MNPLRRSEGYLTQYILELMPLGTEFDRVSEYIQAKKWLVSSASTEHGFLRQDGKRPFTVGAKHIRASIGEYQGFPFIVDVTVFWGFDDKGRLIDVWVWKTANGL